MAKLDIDGFSIAYEKFQGVTHEDTLFIHGNLASKEWWHPCIESLKSSSSPNFSSSSPSSQLIAADWRGYGSSKGLKEKSDIDFNRFAEDQIALVEEFNLKDVHVVGHSTGGLIAMLAILKRPDLFKSCTLLDSVGPKGLELELPLDQVLAHFHQMSLDKDYCTQVLAATIEGVDPNSASFQNLAQITWQCDKIMWQGVPEVLATTIDITDRMKELSLPVLILHGQKDLVLPLSGSEKMNQLITTSKLEVLENQGHSCNMEAPDKLAGLLSQFWASI